MADELTYEPALDEGRREGDNSGAVYHAKAGAAQSGEVPTSASVMSSVTVTENGKFRNGFAVSPRSGSVIPATPEAAANARQAKVAKRERYRQMAEQGLLTAAQAVREGVMTHEQAWGKVIEGQSELALSPELRGSTQAAALVGKAIGALASDKAAEQSGNSISISLTDAAVAQIAAALAGKLDGDE